MKRLWLFLLMKFNNNKDEKMSLLTKEPITRLEKWINRIITIAIAIFEFIRNLPPDWLNK